jgi:hypothetical protein
MPAVVLTDDVLNGLLSSPKYQGLPCLQFRQPSGSAKPCNCANKTPRKPGIHGENARVCIFQLQPQQLAEVKAALAAEQLVVYMNTPGFPRRAVI